MAQLREYMYGSAGVIGLQMLPILGTVDGDASAATAARALGDAFQLTNFIRDAGEDLERGRVYLPTEELATFGVDEAMLRRCRRNGQVPPQLRRALAHLIAITPNPASRCWLRRADQGSGPHSPCTGPSSTR
jgi:phytoene synthase